MSEAVLRYALLAFSSLFSIINPIASAPIFVGLTTGWTPEARRRSALKAAAAAGGTLAAFALAGGAIFSFFGITVPAFQIVGGILFTTLGINTLLKGKDVADSQGDEHADPSIVPIGIPLIAGPGAISTVMVLIGGAHTTLHRAALFGAIAVNVLLTFVVLVLSPRIVAALGVTGQKILGKLMGLITAVIGVQFAINGASAVMKDILTSVKGG